MSGRHERPIAAYSPTQSDPESQARCVRDATSGKCPKCNAKSLYPTHGARHRGRPSFRTELEVRDGVAYYVGTDVAPDLSRYAKEA